jgi:hypothetical protein
MGSFSSRATGFSFFGFGFLFSPVYLFSQHSLRFSVAVHHYYRLVTIFIC